MKTIIKNQKGIIPFKARVTNIAIWVVLSARGSISLPKFVIKLNFLAIKPSSTSVIPEAVKNIKASTYLSWNRNTIIKGININLSKHIWYVFKHF